MKIAYLAEAVSRKKSNYKDLQNILDSLIDEFFNQSNKCLISYTNIMRPGDIGSEWTFLGEHKMTITNIDNENNIHCDIYLGYPHGSKDFDNSLLYRGILAIEGKFYEKYKNDCDSAKAALTSITIKKIKNESLKKSKHSDDFDKNLYITLAKSNIVIDNIFMEADNTLRLKFIHLENTDENLRRASKFLVNVIRFISHNNSPCTEMTLLYDCAPSAEITDMNNLIDENNFKNLISILLKYYLFDCLNSAFFPASSASASFWRNRYDHYTKDGFIKEFGILFTDEKNCIKTYNSILEEYIKIYKSSNRKDIIIKNIKGSARQSSNRKAQTVCKLSVNTGELEVEYSNTKFVPSNITVQFSLKEVPSDNTFMMDIDKITSDNCFFSINLNDSFAKSINIKDAYCEDKLESDYFNNGYGVAKLARIHGQPNDFFIDMIDDDIAENCIKYDFKNFLKDYRSHNINLYDLKNSRNTTDFSPIDKTLGFENDFDVLTREDKLSVLSLIKNIIKTFNNYVSDNTDILKKENYK